MKRRLTTLLLALAILASLTVPAMAVGPGQSVYTEVIAPQYEDVGMFSEGLAPAKKDGRWGYIDTNGTTVIPFEYLAAYNFNEGLAVVGQEYPHGIDPDSASMMAIKADGHVQNYFLIGYHLEHLRTTRPNSFLFHNGHVLTTWGDWPYCHEIYAAKYGDNIVFSNRNCIPRSSVNEGMIVVWSNDGYRLYGWANTSGEVVKLFPKYEANKDWGAPTKITRVSPFNQGLAPVWYEYNYVGFMNRNFQWVIQPQFDDYCYEDDLTYRVFGETGLAIVSKNGKWGAITKTGQTAIPFQYEKLECIREGMLPFRQNGKWGFLDAVTMKVAIPARYQAVSYFHNGMAAIYDGYGSYLIDRKGNAISGTGDLATSVYFTRDDDGNMVSACEPGEYIAIERGGKYGFARVDFKPALPARSELSSWAYDEAVAAIQKNLVPASLQNLYHYNITRAEFCDLLVQALEEMSGKDIETLVKERTGRESLDLFLELPFQDTNDYNILAANALGIVTGRGNGKFDPYATITRQEAAALLMRAAKVLGMDTANPSSAGFADDAQLASWGREAVNFVAEIGVMNGVSNNNFAPAGTYTREQSYVTIYRLFEAVSES